MKTREVHVKTVRELSDKLQQSFGTVESVLDIGCGIRPFSWIRSKSIICVEPFDEYRKRLIATFGSEGLVAIKGDLESVSDVVDVSAFSMVTLIDVIEHLPKDVGERALRNLMSSGVQNLLVFTPKGFMPQHAVGNDAWGFSSGTQQEHLSGWDPEEFLTLGFNEFWYVTDLHVENGEKWDGMLAIYSQKNEYASSYAFWDPEELPNKPQGAAKNLVVFGRRNRYSGTVIGTHGPLNFQRKIYIPSLSFLPMSIRSFYKNCIKLIFKFVG